MNPVYCSVELSGYVGLYYFSYWCYVPIFIGFAGLKIISPELQSLFTIIKKVMSAISTRHAGYGMIQTPLTDKFINTHFL